MLTSLTAHRSALTWRRAGIALVAGGLGAVVAGAPAAWAAPTAQVDRACYLPGQPIDISGAGFTPNGGVQVFMNPFGPGDPDLSKVVSIQATAGPDGSLRVSSTVARKLLAEGGGVTDVGVSANDSTLVAQGAGPDTATGFTLFGLTERDVTVAPWDDRRVNPRARARFEVSGLIDEIGDRLYAHYVRGGKAVKSVSLGVLRGPCGTLRKSMRQFPFRPVPAGSYLVAFSTGARYAPGAVALRYRSVRVPARRAVR